MDWESFIRPELAGMTPYAPGLRASEVRERTGRSDVSKLSSNEYPLGPVPRAIEAMAAVLPQLNRYPDGSVRALKERLAAHWGADARHLAVTNGSNELLRLIAQAVLRPGDEVVYAWPSFIVYPLATRMFGGVAKAVPLTADARHDLPAMLAAITERTRIVFVCNPNNPTGTIATRGELESFLEAVPEHVLVVLDEAYFEFVEDADYPDGLRYFDGIRPIVVARTFSKMYSLAGARVGYGFLPSPLLSAVDAIREPFNVNTVAQIGAYYSLEDQEEVARRKCMNLEQKARVCECLDALGIDYVPSHTNFVWIRTTKPAEAFEDLLRGGVIARGFGDTPAVRLGIGTVEDTRRTIEALQEIVARRGSF